MRPGRRALAQLGVVVALGLLVSIEPVLLPVFWIALVMVFGFAAIEALTVFSLNELSVQRSHDPSLPLGEWSEVRLRIVNRGLRDLDLDVHDHHPSSFAVEGLPRRLEIAAGAWTELSYRVRPSQRGRFSFGRLEAWSISPFEAIERRLLLGQPSELRVLPNFRTVSRYAFLAADNRLGQMGIRLQQRRGEGLEFHELRDYRPGDSQRQIDWKATSRRGRLISREYQDERDQQVVMLLDCGRRMRATVGELEHFDHVLNAALLLTWAASREGDAVGLMTFAGERRWVAPLKGKLAMSSMMSSIYDLRPTSQAPDYLAAITELLGRQRRRALIVLMTNLRDEDAMEILPAAASLRKRHLLLVASLRETSLADPLRARADDLDQGLLQASARSFLEARRNTHRRLRSAGVLTLDVEPQDLATEAVVRYLQVKRAGML